jgi:hypothetical protein
MHLASGRSYDKMYSERYKHAFSRKWVTRYTQTQVKMGTNTWHSERP